MCLVTPLPHVGLPLSSKGAGGEIPQGGGWCSLAAIQFGHHVEALLSHAPSCLGIPRSLAPSCHPSSCLLHSASSSCCHATPLCLHLTLHLLPGPGIHVLIVFCSPGPTAAVGEGTPAPSVCQALPCPIRWQWLVVVLRVSSLKWCL